MHNAISSLPSGMKTSAGLVGLLVFVVVAALRCSSTFLCLLLFAMKHRHQQARRDSQSRLLPVGIRARANLSLPRPPEFAQFSTILARQTRETVRRPSAMIPGIETRESETVRWIIQSSCEDRTTTPHIQLRKVWRGKGKRSTFLFRSSSE